MVVVADMVVLVVVGQTIAKSIGKEATMRMRLYIKASTSSKEGTKKLSTRKSTMMLIELVVFACLLLTLCHFCNKIFMVWAFMTIVH